MTSSKPSTEFVPGRGYSEADWEDVDSPELTEAELASLRPARDVLPTEFFEMVENERSRKARGRPTLAAPKKQVTLRLDADIVDSFRAEGDGWQSRINATLRKARGL